MLIISLAKQLLASEEWSGSRELDVWTRIFVAVKFYQVRKETSSRPPLHRNKFHLVMQLTKKPLLNSLPIRWSGLILVTLNLILGDPLCNLRLLLLRNCLREWESNATKPNLLSRGFREWAVDLVGSSRWNTDYRLCMASVTLRHPPSLLPYSSRATQRQV
jgi:hypothetical protein